MRINKELKKILERGYVDDADNVSDENDKNDENDEESFILSYAQKRLILFLDKNIPNEKEERIKYCENLILDALEGIRAGGVSKKGLALIKEKILSYSKEYLKSCASITEDEISKNFIHKAKNILDENILTSKFEL